MLEIIALIYLTKKIGTLALDKGQKEGKWKLILVLAWIAAEITGIIIGKIIFGKEDLVGSILIGLGCAGTSYFLVHGYLTKMPANISDDDINNIGQ